ncbi:MAG: hypothetical protein R3B52_00620 [Candidatus Paceibacterota bacterium]
MKKNIEQLPMREARHVLPCDKQVGIEALGRRMMVITKTGVGLTERLRIFKTPQKERYTVPILISE